MWSWHGVRFVVFCKYGMVLCNKDKDHQTAEPSDCILSLLLFVVQKVENLIEMDNISTLYIQ